MIKAGVESLAHAFLVCVLIDCVHNAGMSNATPYKPLPRKTLVAFKRGKAMKIAYVVWHDLNPNRKPGIGRVVYKCQPCTVGAAGVNDWGRMFRPVPVPATKVTEVSNETAVQMLASGEAKGWS